MRLTRSVIAATKAAGLSENVLMMNLVTDTSDQLVGVLPKQTPHRSPKTQGSPLSSWHRSGSKRKRINLNEGEVIIHNEAISNGSNRRSKKTATPSTVKLETPRDENDSVVMNRDENESDCWEKSPAQSSTYKTTQESTQTEKGRPEIRTNLSRIFSSPVASDKSYHIGQRESGNGDSLTIPVSATKTPNREHNEKVGKSATTVNSPRIMGENPDIFADVLLRRRQRIRKKIDTEIPSVEVENNNSLNEEIISPTASPKHSSVDDQTSLSDDIKSESSAAMFSNQTEVSASTQTDSVMRVEEIGLFNCSDDVEIVGTLGEGTDGKVLDAIISQQRVALKQSKPQESSASHQQRIFNAWSQSARELHYMRKVKQNDYFVKCLGACDGLDHTCIALEKMDLRLSQYQRSHMGDCRIFAEPVAKYILNRVCEGMRILHEEVGICHGDLAFRNLLLQLNEDGDDLPFRVKIGDFGRVKALSDAPKCFVAHKNFNFLENVDVGYFGREVLYRVFCGQAMPQSYVKDRSFGNDVKDHVVPKLPDESRELLGKYFDLCARCVSDGIRPRFSEILEWLEDPSRMGEEPNEPLFIDPTLMNTIPVKKVNVLKKKSAEKSSNIRLVEPIFNNHGMTSPVQKVNKALSGLDACSKNATIPTQKLQKTPALSKPPRAVVLDAGDKKAANMNSAGMKNSRRAEKMLTMAAKKD